MSSLAVSTSWLSFSVTDGEEMLFRIADLGAETIEIDYRLSEATLRQLEIACAKRNVTPVSMHAVCPAPDDKPNPRGAERFSLADANEEKRQNGVRDVIETMRRASGMGIEKIVVHAGWVPMPSGSMELRKAFDDGLTGTVAGMELVNDLKIARLAARGTGFDQLLKSVDELAEGALRTGVTVGIENRYHLNEYPNYEELAIILLTFSDAPVGFWLDVGHAQAQDNLGVSPHIPYLTEFNDRIVGAHLHDVIGYRDHLPPSNGSGSVDFKLVRSLLPTEATLVYELRDGVPDDEAARGYARLAELMRG